MNPFKLLRDHAAPRHSGWTDGPRIERIRHAVEVRTLRVDAVDHLTPGMLRVSLSGDDLADFVSLGFDDHMKIFSPTVSGEIARRDYTPRRYDADARTLVVDFAVHDAGPATLWALGAQPGDQLRIGGPKGSAIIGPDVRRWLLVGDETALPAIGRHIEEARSGVAITSLVAVSGPHDEQSFETQADHTAFWVHRPLSAAADAKRLIAALRTVEIEPDTFVWIAVEASVARAVRAYLATERGQPLNWMKAAGYWRVGEADAHERIG